MATGRGPGEFAALLQPHRAAVGVSQEELAERAGLSRRGMSDLERGQRRAPHPATMRQLAEALGLGIGERAALLASGFFNIGVGSGGTKPESGLVRTPFFGPTRRGPDD